MLMTNKKHQLRRRQKKELKMKRNNKKNKKKMILNSKMKKIRNQKEQNSKESNPNSVKVLISKDSKRAIQVSQSHPQSSTESWNKIHLGVKEEQL